MRKTVFIFFLFVAYKPLPAQVIIALLFGDKLNTGAIEFGLTVGPSFTDITGIAGKVKAGLNLGLYFTIRLSDRLSMHPEGIAKGSYGARDLLPYGTGNDSLDALFTGGEVKRKINALSLPVLLRYQVKGKWFAELGPQVNLLLKPQDLFTNKVDGNELSYTTTIRDHITRFDIGLAAGLIYKLRKEHGMGLGLRYYGGFTDVQKATNGQQRNSMWQLNVTIPIGAGKAHAPAPAPVPASL